MKKKKEEYSMYDLVRKEDYMELKKEKKNQ